jgi:extradiol dioxygenase family protein
VNHLHFEAPDVEATRRFYETYFAFQPHLRLRDTVVLTNDRRFFLAIDPGNPSGEERLHFGFCLSTAEEVHRLHERMLADRIPLAQALKAHSENAVSFYCFDPAGNRIEVGWYRPLT